eukprot:Hpha_TRINITY_DN13098_c0_g1::TRINITY_DN13098_c0_g1_i1::g.69003::m.69003
MGLPEAGSLWEIILRSVTSREEVERHRLEDEEASEGQEYFLQSLQSQDTDRDDSPIPSYHPLGPSPPPGPPYHPAPPYAPPVYSNRLASPSTPAHQRLAFDEGGNRDCVIEAELAARRMHLAGHWSVIVGVLSRELQRAESEASSYATWKMPWPGSLPAPPAIPGPPPFPRPASAPCGAARRVFRPPQQIDYRPASALSVQSAPLHQANVAPVVQVPRMPSVPRSARPASACICLHCGLPPPDTGEDNAALESPCSQKQEEEAVEAQLHPAPCDRHFRVALITPERPGSRPTAEKLPAAVLVDAGDPGEPVDPVEAREAGKQGGPTAMDHGKLPGTGPVPCPVSPEVTKGKVDSPPQPRSTPQSTNPPRLAREGPAAVTSPVPFVSPFPCNMDPMHPVSPESADPVPILPPKPKVLAGGVTSSPGFPPVAMAREEAPPASQAGAVRNPVRTRDTRTPAGQGESEDPGPPPPDYDDLRPEGYNWSLDEEERLLFLRLMAVERRELLRAEENERRSLYQVLAGAVQDEHERRC